MSGTFDARDKRPHSVYRIFDADDRLLYIGCTRNVEQRLTLHHIPRRPGSRVTSQEYPTKADARAAERAAIEAEAPLFNVQHNKGRHIRLLHPVTDEDRRRAAAAMGAVLWPDTA